MKATIATGAMVSGFVLALIAWAQPFPAPAADGVSFAGRMKCSGEYALDRQSVRDKPEVRARLIVDGRKTPWRFHAWLEGGWDGTVRDGEEEGTSVRRFDAVYQVGNPFLDLKELYVERELSRVDWRVGVQRFSWGRLDEYPINDLFNPWDYRQFIVQSMEDRKIGVPAVSAGLGRGDWNWQLVWVPWFVPYRLPRPGSRWSPAPELTVGAAGSATMVRPREPELPARTAENGALGFRVQHLGEIEWAVNLFHGFDPRPVFRSTALSVTESPEGLAIDTGYVPSFHRISAVGLDGAAVAGPLSLRAEAAYTRNRLCNVRQELWGYPDLLAPGLTPLNSIETESDTLDYGIAADYSPFEDGLFTMQAQQTVILDHTDAFYERTVETLLWANLKAGWFNQKVETSLNLAWNPEHAANMIRAGLVYVFTDSWKAGMHALFLNGPQQSLFGRFAANDQVGLELMYAW